jgi:hypothetical protein
MPRLVFLCGLVRTRPYIHGLIGVTVVLLAFGVTVRLLRLADPITARSFERLRLGMTEWDVQGVIGLPPGDYYRGPRGIGGVMSRGPFGSPLKQVGVSEQRRTVAKEWWGDYYAISVEFDRQGAAVACCLMKVYPAVVRRNPVDALATVALGLVTLAALALQVRFRRCWALDAVLENS